MPAAPNGTNHPVFRDKRLIAAAEEYFAKKAALKVLEARLAELKAVIEGSMGDATTAYAGARVLSLTTFPSVPALPERTIDKSMVGQAIPGKPGRGCYTQLRVQ